MGTVEVDMLTARTRFTGNDIASVTAVLHTTSGEICTPAWGTNAKLGFVTRGVQARAWLFHLAKWITAFRRRRLVTLTRLLNGTQDDEALV